MGVLGANANRKVTIQVTSEGQDTYGAPEDSWTDIETDVPCMVIPKTIEAQILGDRQVMLRHVKVLFDVPVNLSGRHRLLFDDAQTGQLRKLYCKGSKDVIEGRFLWVAYATEILR